MHSQTQIRSLHMRRADVLGIGPSVNDSGYDLHDPWWGVPRVGAIVLSVIPEQFNQLREVSLSTEDALDRAVEVIPVRRDLKPILAQPLFEIGQKKQRGFLGALADLKARHQFGFLIERDKDPLIAKLRRVTLANSAGFLAHEAPKLIALQIPGPEIADRRKGILASLRCREHHGEDRVLVQAGDSRNGANAHPFQHHRKGLCRSGRIGVVRPEFGKRLRKGRFAGCAAPALDAALTEVPKFLASLVLASGAGHGASPLDFSAEKGHNKFGSGLWLTPRFGLAPQPVSAGSGALCVKSYGLGWWFDRDIYGVTGSESNFNSDYHRCFILPESPVPAW